MIEGLKEQPFVSHLIELRDRLLRAMIAVGVIFLCLFPFNNDIYVMVATPLMAHLPEGSTMIATEVASPFLTPFKLTLMAAVFLGMPFILYQLWMFIAPGLYKHEKRLIMPLVASSVLLFYVGVVFAYYVVFPLVFAFMAGTTPDGVVMATDIAKYLDFVLSLFFAFGLAFEIPIATIIVVSMGMTTPDKLVEKRPYIIVGAFCVGMLLTPPDVISQTLLALPMWILFEFGVFFSRIILRNKIKREKEESATGSESDAASTDAPSFDGELNLDDGVDDPTDPDRFVPLTEEELDAELDLIEDDDDDDLNEQESVAGDGLAADSVEQKLQQIQAFRNQGNEAGARELLYEVLADGDADQVNVARNILVQLDEEEVPGP
ncbi:twin-arginine translocase subunit TatC [Candidatus Vondammii sp. HM_W22]|uniref:twin-arginine translocase subunit TatC n=1 Tax=Candidatus Vondammii sp. HM_W22 TaxID=2687299 RepID=UPI001F13CBEF|nr:twin-arginine translocase subunit TatC [Candidatus Vondammii sp. HM_W22]